MSGKITKIERQSRRADRCSVYIDDEYAFGLTEEILLKRKLRLNQELSSQEIDSLLFEDERARARAKAFELLSYRDHSTKELSLKLSKRGFKKEIVELLVVEMQSQGYLDDESFAMLFARSRVVQKQVGRKELSHQLKQKGITETTLQKILDEIYEEFDEKALARQQAEKKIRSFQKDDPAKSKKSLIDFLYRKGFDWEVIEDVLSHYGNRFE